MTVTVETAVERHPRTVTVPDYEAPTDWVEAASVVPRRRTRRVDIGDKGEAIV